MPVILTCSIFPVCPDRISTALRATPKTSARVRMSSSLAAPSTGGAAILTLSAPSCSPTTLLFDARGTTRTLKTKPPFFVDQSINALSE